ncbi:DNA gyrase inhibitor YacG [Shimia abyssi]|uniref:DNA gyrase inhibitor YacG n=1 Tax=Shimia abyssi TaxID=1662395 RepID=UPI000D0CC817|nr:DNA gyrase inhibitor YacG [Shimia abyssi]
MSCPICAKPVSPKYRPFCSKRCAEVDLSKWLKGGYSVVSDDQEGLEDVLTKDVSKSQLRH